MTVDRLRKAAFGGDVVVFRRHVEKMFADSEYKWGPISRGREEEGSWERERIAFSPVLYHKGRERRTNDRAKCLRGSVVVVVGDSLVNPVDVGEEI